MEIVHYSIVSDVNTGLLAREVVSGLKDMIEIGSEILQLKVFDPS